jgi:cytochrome c peroxidase
MSGNSSFDQWRAGTLSSYPVQAQEGFALFGQVGCAHCHNGQAFSDFSFHNTGVAWDATTETFTDLGRYAISGNTDDKGAFKTPTLRDLSLRGPYMHNGSFSTLAEVVQFYNQGGIDNPELDPALGRPLNLSQAQMNALVTFLQTLAGQGYQDSGPAAFPQ